MINKDTSIYISRYRVFQVVLIINHNKACLCNNISRKVRDKIMYILTRYSWSISVKSILNYHQDVCLNDFHGSKIFLFKTFNKMLETKILFDYRVEFTLLILKWNLFTKELGILSLFIIFCKNMLHSFRLELIMKYE